MVDVKERTFIVKHFLKEEELFWYTENVFSIFDNNKYKTHLLFFDKFM